MMLGNGEDSDYGPRASSGSEVALVTDQLEASPIPNVSDLVSTAAREVPNISNMNISNARNIHVGTKIVTVTQNVHTNEVVKDVSFPRYIWEIVKNSTRAERISCVFAMTLMFLCVALIVYFKIFYITFEEPDIAPHEWYITRDMWLAEHYNKTAIDPAFEPLRLVIIQHSVSPECHKFINCASEIRNLQLYFIQKKDRDIPYNFLIGNDGRVYEGRGWQAQGAHTLKYNTCSIGIGFIGDYREVKGSYTRVTEAQLNRTSLLLAEGVRRGFLRPGYKVVGAMDLRSTASPGSNLYKAIQMWDHYDHENLFRNKSCEVINSMPFSDGKFASTTTTETSRD